MRVLIPVIGPVFVFIPVVVVVNNDTETSPSVVSVVTLVFRGDFVFVKKVLVVALVFGTDVVVFGSVAMDDWVVALVSGMTVVLFVTVFVVFTVVGLVAGIVFAFFGVVSGVVKAVVVAIGVILVVIALAQAGFLNSWL